MENDGTACGIRESEAERELDALAAGIVAAAGRLSAATCGWLLEVARFDAVEGHARAGFGSTAAWLGFSCGLAARTAVDHVQVARALAAHPGLAAGMAAGRLSYSHVRAIARVAEPGERALVDELIEVAGHGTVAQLEAIVRGLRTVDDHENPPERADREYTKFGWTDGSQWRLSARLDPERGAVVAAAIETVARAEGVSAADGLVRLAEIGLAALADTGNPPGPLRGHERAAVVIHLDASRVPTAPTEPTPPTEPAGSAEPAADGGERVETVVVAEPARPTGSAEPSRPRPYARIADGPGLPDRVVKMLLCAGRVRTVVRDGAGVLDVGRAHRLVTDRQYAALLIRHHGHCARPGCPNTKNLHAHHRIAWIDGGRTDLDNLLLLCEPHHLGHHDGEFTIEPPGPGSGGGRFRFLDRNGHQISPALPTLDPDPTADPHTRYAHLDPTAATTDWDGQPLDHAYAIAVLAHRRQQQREREQTRI